MSAPVPVQEFEFVATGPEEPDLATPEEDAFKKYLATRDDEDRRREQATLAEQDAILVANGYAPIAVIGKAPVANDWQKRPDPAVAIIAERTAFPDALSTGLLCGELGGGDVDLVDQGHANAIGTLILTTLGNTDMVRIGSKGGLICYRNRTPIKKITVSTDVVIGGKKQKVEFLGLGQQFVAYGAHAETGKPYRWYNADKGAEPLHRKLSELVEVTPDQVRQCARAVAQKLTELGFAGVKITGDMGRTSEAGKTAAPPTGDPVSLEILRDMLSHLDPNCDRDLWLRWIPALRAAPLPDDEDEAIRRELADEWSSGTLWKEGDTVPSNYEGPEDVGRIFDAMPPRPGDPDAVHFGTLVHAAQAAGYTGPTVFYDPAAKMRAEGVFRGPEVSDARPDRREIKLVKQYLGDAIRDGEQSLIEQGAGYYQRGGKIVRSGVGTIEISGGRKTAGMQLFEVSPEEIREQMSAAAIFVRYTAKGERREIDCPDEVARTYSKLHGRWNLPHLTGLITAPTLRLDGSVLDRPGYDEETGLLYIPNREFPSIPDRPARANAESALAKLKALIRGFPFETATDRAVALSAMLSAPVAPVFKATPLHGFNAPRRGNGKGKLAELPSFITLGRSVAAVAQGRDEAETEKRISAKVLEGHTLIRIDNCSLPLEGDFLNMLITEETVAPRILGQSKAPNIPARVLVEATGNNLAIRGDLTRRMLVCTVDAGMEFPEQRQFDFDPVAEAKRNHPALLAAVLTILRAYIVAGRPSQTSPLGSFEEWNIVRDALIWLGEADPCGRRTEIEEGDPEHNKLGALLAQWDAAGMPASGVPVKQLITIAVERSNSRLSPNSGLLDVLQEIAPNHNKLYGIDANSLGQFLRKHQKSVVRGRRLLRAGMTDGAIRWALRK